ncbi:bromodomain-containing protein 8 [Rhipicephalus sanguineus]|uniref:bromodomain-containing protein 8 n=1 Tax=Rhipicephalus sanguineus TaxID=34632 RepID=UPI0020C37925|nr:bromodomain-containing protein 8 [Rhipicephalus sanguineus]
MIASNLTPQQSDELHRVLWFSIDALDPSSCPLGQATGVIHRINTGDEPPIYRRPYRMSASEHQNIQSEVDKMLAKHLIEPSCSPWASPVVLVHKKDGTWKFRRDIELLRSGQIDDRLEELLKQIQDEHRANEIAEQELQKWFKERELQQVALRAAIRPSYKMKKMSSRYMQEMRRSSSQSEYSEPDSMVGSPLSVEVEDPQSPPSQDIPEVERPCTPQRKVVSPLPPVTPSTPPTPPAVSTSLLTSLLKSPTPSSPVSSVSGLCSLIPSPVHQHKEQSSPRSHLTPSFFNPSAARQLATGTLSPSTTSSTVSRFSPTCTTADAVSRSSTLQMSPHSATSSAPTLSKLLELPPSTPGGCLPSLPFLTASPSVLSPVASQATTSSPLESSNSMDTTADDTSVPGLVSSPVKQTVEDVTAPVAIEPSETPCEVPVVETVESQPEPSPAPEESMEVTEDVPEDVSPRETEAKVEPKEENMEEDVDQAVSPAEGESMMETVASEEMVIETVIEDSLSSSVNVDDDKESVQSEPEHGTCTEQETKPESETSKEALEAPVEQACPESESKDKDDKDEKDDMDDQLAADGSDSVKDATKSEVNDDELPPESPDVLLKKDEQTQEEDVPEDPQPTADEEDDDAEESKDAWAPGTVSSPSPAGETMSNLDEAQSEDMDDDKLKDDKSSIDDAKTPETPSGTEPDMKDDGSQHMESGTEDGTGDLSKHLLGSVGDSVPNSPASVLQGEDSEVVRDYKVWKKSIMLVWRAAANHKFANVFLHPVTDEMAPGYHSIVYRPMDLLTIKKNIESGYIKTTLEFQRDMMLMFQNAIMYNSSDHDVFHMAIEMQKEVMGHIQDFLATQLMVKTTETKSLRGRDGREKKVEFGKDDKGDERKKKLSLPAEEPVAKKRRMRANE